MNKQYARLYKEYNRLLNRVCQLHATKPDTPTPPGWIARLQELDAQMSYIRDESADR